MLHTLSTVIYSFWVAESCSTCCNICYCVCCGAYCGTKATVWKLLLCELQHFPHTRTHTHAHTHTHTHTHTYKHTHHLYDKSNDSQHQTFLHKANFWKGNLRQVSRNAAVNPVISLNGSNSRELDSTEKNPEIGSGDFVFGFYLKGFVFHVF